MYMYLVCVKLLHYCYLCNIFCVPLPFSVTLAGKDKAVEVKCVPILVALLADLKTSVKANAAGALMM